MRSLNDLVGVRVELLASVQLDMERVREDPVWDIITQGHEPSEAELSRAIEEYTKRYLDCEVLLAEHPATCGPATNLAFNINVVTRNTQKETDGSSVCTYSSE